MTTTLRMTAVLAALLLAACGTGKPDATNKAFGKSPEKGNARTHAIVVQVETARAGDLAVDNTAAGTVVAATQSSVAAGEAGTVKRLLKKAGDWVKTGDPVIQLDTSQLELSLKIAQANLVNARINAGLDEKGHQASDSKVMLQLQSAQKSYDSAQALAKIGGIAASDLDTAQANLEAAKMAVTQSALAVDTARLQVQQAQLNLAMATITAPYEGQISVINVNPGEYVSASTPAFGLVSRVQEISFSVSPSDAVGLSIGQPVRFLYNGSTYPTKVTQAPSAPINGLVTLTADLPATFRGTLGTVGTVSYTVVLARGTIVTLPTLQSAENKTFVYQVGAENKVSPVNVTILSESGSEAAVSGLLPGAVVLDNPPPGLLPGAQVTPVDAQGKPIGGPATGSPSVEKDKAVGTATDEQKAKWKALRQKNQAAGSGAQ